MKLGAVAYTRVSTVEQVENCSLRTQRAACLKYAASNDLEIVEVFEEKGQSAKTVARTELQRLMKWLQTRHGAVHALLIHEPSRLARNTLDYLTICKTLEGLGVRLISVTTPIGDGPFGQFVSLVQAGVAELDNALRAQRVTDGMKTALQGGRRTHEAPTGYVNAGSPSGPSLRPDPERAPLMQEAFERVATGEIPSAVHVDLVRRGLTTRRTGRPLSATRFYQLLRSQVYVSVNETTLGRAPGDWPALIDDNTFLRVQGALAKRARTGSKIVRHSGRRLYRQGVGLRCVLVCAVCKRTVTGSTTTSKGRSYAYCYCKKGHVRARVGLVDQKFRDWLCSLRVNDVFVARLERTIRRIWDAERKKMLQRGAAARAEIRSLEDKIRRFDEAFVVERAISREVYDENRALLRTKLAHAKINEDVHELDALDLDGVLAFATRLLRNPTQLWTTAQPDESRQLLEAFFPQGVEIDAGLNFTNRGSATSATAYWWLGGTERRMVDQTGVEPVTS